MTQPPRRFRVDTGYILGEALEETADPRAVHSQQLPMSQDQLDEMSTRMQAFGERATRQSFMNILQLLAAYFASKDPKHSQKQKAATYRVIDSHLRAVGFYTRWRQAGLVHSHNNIIGSLRTYLEDDATSIEIRIATREFLLFHLRAIDFQPPRQSASKAVE